MAFLRTRVQSTNVPARAPEVTEWTIKPINTERTEITLRLIRERAEYLIDGRLLTQGVVRKHCLWRSHRFIQQDAGDRQATMAHEINKSLSE